LPRGGALERGLRRLAWARVSCSGDGRCRWQRPAVAAALARPPLTDVRGLSRRRRGLEPAAVGGSVRGAREYRVHADRVRDNGALAPAAHRLPGRERGGLWAAAGFADVDRHRIRLRALAAGNRRRLVALQYADARILAPRATIFRDAVAQP